MSPVSFVTYRNDFIIRFWPISCYYSLKPDFNKSENDLQSYVRALWQWVVQIVDIIPNEFNYWFLFGYGTFVAGKGNVLDLLLACKIVVFLNFYGYWLDNLLNFQVPNFFGKSSHHKVQFAYSVVIAIYWFLLF